MERHNAISATVLTRNSSKYLAQVLDALKLCDEVVLFDTGSVDSSLEIARRYPNVSIYQGLFDGFGPTHNRASGVAKHPWIFSVDSDEIASPELIREILTIPLDEQSVYSFPRHNYFRGKRIRGCGWSPDRQVRLYNRQKTRFTDARVHEAVITEGMRLVALQGAITHYSYESIEDFLTKMQSYSELFAQQNRGVKSSSVWHAVGHAFFAFFKSYILKRGIRDGSEGFIISSYNAHTAFYKYLKLAEANRKSQDGTA